MAIENLMPTETLDIPSPDLGNLEMDKFKLWAKTAGRGGTPLVGKGICAAPFEMETILDYTGLRGSGSNIYHFLISQLPKWEYYMKKVDEWIEVSPTWAEYYNLTIGQKQKLEASIKQGLTSAAQAVADFELLKHDLRRYREVLNYFIHAHKTKDEHVLRSLFVDRVDAHTGEGYSMITMAKRWPTIITDFIRMRSEWNDRGKIRKELDVSDAEATVLLTKNQLYKEWRELFLPTIKDRVSRIEVLVESRRRSIDEYRNWLKPYVARYKIIRERSEAQPPAFATNPFYTPVFGPAKAESGARLWFWRPFSPPEKGKAESIPQKKKRGFIIDPYDDLVREWKEKIEKHYKITISDEEVDKILEDAKQIRMEGFPPAMDPNFLYYIFFDANIYLSLLRTPPPEGLETDNLMFLPIKAWVMSQNVVLLHLIELYAFEKSFEQSINRLIGTREEEVRQLEMIEQEFLGGKKEKERKFRKSMSSFKKKVKPSLGRFASLFVKPGPYEPVFVERVSKMYARGIGAYYGQVVDYIIKQMHVE